MGGVGRPLSEEKFDRFLLRFDEFIERFDAREERLSQRFCLLAHVDDGHQRKAGAERGIGSYIPSGWCSEKSDNEL